eukprot:7251501-Karenia_brevis.AAC.1
MEILSDISSYKPYGISWRRTGTGAGVCVAEKDKEKLFNSTAAKLTLDELPFKIKLQMHGLKPFPGLPRWTISSSPNKNAMD